jgi:hypothetical protein
MEDFALDHETLCLLRKLQAVFERLVVDPIAFDGGDGRWHRE